MDNLNIQGVLCSLYVDGNWFGINRPDGRGGDLVKFNDQEWLVVSVPELWPDWCRLIVCLQR